MTGINAGLNQHLPSATVIMGSLAGDSPYFYQNNQTITLTAIYERDVN